MAANTAFVGTIPSIYHHVLGPMLFRPYASDLAHRLRLGEGDKILELAAGTGILTEALVETMPPGAKLVATDLNAPMLEMAQARIEGEIEWQVADALKLPFEKDSFDAVVCQFGVMFYPDKAAGYRETLRVLRPGGTFLFNVWGSVEENGAVGAVARIVAGHFPDDPPSFFNVPYGYARDQIETDMRAGGFEEFEIEEVKLNTGTFPAEQIAVGFTQGTPLVNFFVDRGIEGSAIAAEVQRGLEEEFGGGEIPLMLKAWVVEAVRKL